MEGGSVVRKALIIGLNDYPEHPLSYCDDDAVAINTLLETDSNGDPNFQTRLVKDRMSRSEMRAAIKELFSGDSEIALLYFSGHGINEGPGYLVTTDYEIDDYGVSMSEILKYANESECKNRVIILDCCYSGLFGRNGVTDSKEAVIDEGVTIIAASQDYEPAMEDSDYGHGVFTNLLIEGLKGGAADVAGRITPAALYSFVDQSLDDWSQRPVFKTNTKRFLPIRKVQPKIEKEILRKICTYFPNPQDDCQLDPSYEFTNSVEYKVNVVEPYKDDEHVEIFGHLQKYASEGLVKPINADHMYFAAMNKKSCRLTALGAHYWNMVKQNLL